MALMDLVRSVGFRLFAAAALAGGLICVATPASAWYNQTDKGGCIPPNEDSTPQTNYICGYASTADQPNSSVTSVAVSLQVFDAGGATICADAADDSYHGCSGNPTAPTDGSVSTLTFSSASDLASWTGGDNRYAYVLVQIQSKQDQIFGVTVTTSN